MSERELKQALESFDDDFGSSFAAASKKGASKAKNKRNHVTEGSGRKLLSNVEKISRKRKEREESGKRALQLLKALDAVSPKLKPELVEKILATQPGTKRPPAQPKKKEETVFTEEDFEKFEEDYFVAGTF